MNTYLFQMKNGTRVMVDMSPQEFQNKIKQFGEPNHQLETLSAGMINTHDIDYTIGRVVSAYE